MEKAWVSAAGARPAVKHIAADILAKTGLVPPQPVSRSEARALWPSYGRNPCAASHKSRHIIGKNIKSGRGRAGMWRVELWAMDG